MQIQPPCISVRRGASDRKYVTNCLLMGFAKTLCVPMLLTVLSVARSRTSVSISEGQHNLREWLQ